MLHCIIMVQTLVVDTKHQQNNKSAEPKDDKKSDECVAICGMKTKSS